MNVVVFIHAFIFTCTALQKFGNALEKWDFGQYQHKSLSFIGANTLPKYDPGF